LTLCLSGGIADSEQHLRVPKIRTKRKKTQNRDPKDENEDEDERSLPKDVDERQPHQRHKMQSLSAEATCNFYTEKIFIGRTVQIHPKVGKELLDYSADLELFNFTIEWRNLLKGVSKLNMVLKHREKESKSMQHYVFKIREVNRFISK